jgi:Helix-turn-helix domain
MSRYRLIPTPAQEAVLRSHCAHARYIWNLAVEQHAHWRPGRAGAPGYLEQCVACTFTLNADVNAARNIAAGHAVTARGGQGTTRPANREPQLLLQSA